MSRHADRWAEYAKPRGLIEAAPARENVRVLRRIIGDIPMVIEIDFARIEVRADYPRSPHVAYARRIELGLSRAHLLATELPFLITGHSEFDERYDVTAKDERSVIAVLDDATRASLLALHALWYEDVHGVVVVIAPNFEECAMLDHAIDIVAKGVPWRPSLSTSPFR